MWDGVIVCKSGIISSSHTDMRLTERGPSLFWGVLDLISARHLNSKAQNSCHIRGWTNAKDAQGHQQQEYLLRSAAWHSGRRRHRLCKGLSYASALDLVCLMIDSSAVIYKCINGRSRSAFLISMLWVDVTLREHVDLELTEGNGRR